VTGLDLRGVPCPMNWVRAKLALEELDAGQRLVLELDPGEPVESVPRSAREEGHGVRVTGTRVEIVKR
jgi:tRNA 2-thiouridine synthesizing protein A